VRALPVSPVPAGQGDAINLGYRKGALWLRFSLAPEPGAPTDWLLEVAYPSLDHVDLYLPRPEACKSSRPATCRPTSALIRIIIWSFPCICGRE
jgi:hypothetical protein